MEDVENQQEGLVETDFYGREVSDSVKAEQQKSKRKDLVKNLLTKSETSRTFNGFKVLIPFAKLIATVVILLVSNPGSCGNLDLWLYLIMADDLIALILRSSVLYNLIKMKMKKRGSIVPDLLNLQNQNFNYQNILYGSSSLLVISNERLKKRQKAKSFLTFLWWLRVLFYIALIIYGQIQLVNLTPECREIEGSRVILTLIYVIFGYLYIGVPVLFFFLLFLFTGRLKCNPCQCLKKKKSKMTKEELNKLKVEKFSRDLPGYHECGICNKEYKNDDDLIRLKCNETHHFHKKCVLQELKKTTCCPICGFDFKQELDENSFSIAALHESQKTQRG